MKPREASVWPWVYAGLAVAAAIAPSTLLDATRGTSIDPVGYHLMAFVGMPLLSVFSGVTGYMSLVRRSTPEHLRANIWSSPPTNPQSNRLAQIIAFGCFGTSAALQARDAPLRLFGIFSIWISLALLISLAVFRARHVRPAIPEKAEPAAPDQRP